MKGSMHRRELCRDEIQSEVLGDHHYDKRRPSKHGAYVLIRFLGTSSEARARARRFLGQHVKVTWANEWNADAVSFNLGFTYEGLAYLLEPSIDAGGTSGSSDPLASAKALLDSIGTPFEELRQTMAARAEALGDTGDSAPERWHFTDGLVPTQMDGSRLPKLHAVVMIFGQDHEAVHHAVDVLKKQEQAANAKLDVHWGNELAEQREHFGYVDGISQPALIGDAADKTGSGTIDDDGNWRGIQPGEFILGYDDEEGPFDGSHFLENGTFFVLRKLEQDVDAFHEYLERMAQRRDVSEAANDDDVPPKEWVAARLMGRYFDGKPLRPKSASHRNINDFRYADDNTGFVCPFGAHIRRVNPRDVSGRISDRSERHRLIRRTLMYSQEDGAYVREERSFGAERRRKPPAENDTPRRQRGMLFGCFNASIGRQFETVQGGWLNGGESAPGRLFTLRDPISGANNEGTGDFIVPRRPIMVLPDVPRFTTTRGGAYFFIPGKKALAYLVERTPSLDQGRRPVDAFKLYFGNLQARRPAPKESVRWYLSFWKALDLAIVPEPPPRPFRPFPKLGKKSKGELEDRVVVLLAPIAEGKRSLLESKLADRRALDKALNDVRVGSAAAIHHARFIIVNSFRSFPSVEVDGQHPFEPVDQKLSDQDDGYLFFACWFDGDRSEFLTSLSKQANQLPFIHCDGWAKVAKSGGVSESAFASFIRERELPVIFAYAAYPNTTEEIRNALRIRERFIQLIAHYGSESKPPVKLAQLKDLFRLVFKQPTRKPRSDAQPSILDAKRAR